MKSINPQQPNPTTTFTQKIKDVLKQTMGDIFEMCQLDKNGKSLYQIKKQKQEKTKELNLNLNTDDQGQQFINYLITNKKVIRSCLHIDEDVDVDVDVDEGYIQEEGMRIWRQVKEKNRGDILQMCKLKGGDQNLRVHLKMEDSQMM